MGCRLKIQNKFGYIEGYTEADPSFIRKYFIKHLALNPVFYKLPENLALLKRIQIEEEFRGQGHGLKLMKEFTAAAKKTGASAILLLADIHEQQASNLDLVQWYKNLGFTTLIKSAAGPVMIKKIK